MTYAYNGLGDVETITGATPYVTNVDYNAAGQMTKIAYGNGVTSDYTYDPQTFRLATLRTQNSALQTLQDFSYQFDRVGNVRSIQDNVHTATQSFAYDDLYRLTVATGSYGSFSYQYDSIGNLTNKEGVLQSYGVAGSKPHAITSASNGMTFEYDTNGNMTTKKKNGVLDQTLRYDIENRLTEVVNENIPAATTLTYTLSPGWNFISFPTLPTNKSISSVLSALTFGTDYNQVSRYNATTQKFEHYVNDSTFNEFTTLEEGKGYEIFISNPAGVSFTLQEESLTLNQSLKTGYNLIGSPRATSISKQEALNNLIQGTDYDSLKAWNGTAFVEATTLEPGKSYFIRMLRATTWTPPKTVKTTKFTYDGDGGRVKKELLASDGTLLTSITYIGGLYEKTGSLATKYVMLGDQRVAQKDPSGTYFIHTDHLGSSNVLTDSTGNQAQLLEYTPYGSVKLNQGTKDIAHKFTGQRLDDTTGLYFYGSRYYDASLGRFIQADSIIQSIHDPQSLNRYTYANNNPVRYIDPSGHTWKTFLKSFVGTVVGGFVTVLAVALSMGTLAPFAPFIFGGVSGGVTGGLTGGWRGALVGAGLGIATAGVVMYGSPLVTTGLLVGGAAYSYKTGGWSGVGDFASGLAGGFLGAYTGIQAGAGFVDAMQSGSLANETGSVRIGSGGAEDGDYPTFRTKTQLPFDPEHPGYANDGPATKAYRYVGPREAALAEKNDFVPNVTRGGRPKPVFLTPDSPITSASQAKTTYNLETTPTHRITVDITKTKLTYGGNVQNGSVAVEVTTNETVPVLRVDPLDR